MKGKTTSSKNKAKVIEAKIANPDLSTRDLERKTGVSKSVAGTIIKKDLGQVGTQSETIAKLIDDNNQILNITGDELLKKLADEDGKIRIDEFIKLRDLALKQNKLVEVTDNTNKEIIVKFEI